MNSHVLSICCTGSHPRARNLRSGAKQTLSAARSELAHGTALLRRMAGGLYDLVDLSARERYEGKRQTL